MFADSIVVLTTHERADWFRAALGDSADFRFDYEKTRPLRDVLANAKLAGGSVAVLDEEHFPSVEEMIAGVESYVDSSHGKSGVIRTVVVCSRRTERDRVLSRLAGYCHIYDLLYGVDGVDIIEPLRDLVENPRTRADVVSLLGSSEEWAAGEEGVGEASQDDRKALASARRGETDPLAVVDLARILRPGQRLMLEVIVR